MRACSRVGVDLSWLCNWDCTTCFYHFDERLHKGITKPWPELQAELDRAVRRGCDHAVAVGWGEPSIAPTVRQFLQYSRDVGMTTSIITNGVAGPEKYRVFYEEDGLDHLHVSAHGLGDVLDAIAERKSAGKKQDELKRWLKETGKPWRSNITLQQLNYRQLPELTDNLLDHGSRHIIYLGFLPHYAWMDPAKCKTVAVHPAVLQPILEACIDKVVAAGRMVTVRYHPLCYLQPQYWKYVTNARYVLFDPWEWDYEKYNPDINQVWPHAVTLGDSVAVRGAPCDSCAVKLHCGGWNKHNVNGLGINLPGVKPEDVPAADRAGNQQRGYWHDQNPANGEKGYFGDRPQAQQAPGPALLSALPVIPHSTCGGSSGGCAPSSGPADSSSHCCGSGGNG